MKTIYFLSLTEPGYSRSWTYYQGLVRQGKKVEYIRLDRPYLKQFLELRSRNLDIKHLVITSPSQLISIYSRVFLGIRPVLDAGWSLFEGEVVSRRSFGFLGLRALKIYLIDYFANLSASLVLVESAAQKRYFEKLFFINKKKVKVLYTGIDEHAFSTTIQPKNYFPREVDTFSVLFRGKYNAEAGLEVLSKATKLLESERISFSIYSPGIPNSLIFSQNTRLSRDFLNKAEIAYLLKSTDLSLGQLSDNPRLSRTIPHKAFEAAFCSTPYLTSKSLGILELFSEDEVFTFEPGSADDLATKIYEISLQRGSIAEVGSKMRNKYEKLATQSVLSTQFIRYLESADK